MTEKSLLRRIRFMLAIFIFGLVLSGVTAFPLTAELEFLARQLGIADRAVPTEHEGYRAWITTVRNALREVDSKYPFIAYGTDWLAFAHLVIAIAFVGPWLDPARNKWVIQWGVINCVAIIPLALICGEIRGIPWGWRAIDCSFGVFGVVPLLFCLRWIRKLESM